MEKWQMIISAKNKYTYNPLFYIIIVANRYYSQINSIRVLKISNYVRDAISPMLNIWKTLRVDVSRKVGASLFYRHGEVSYIYIAKE